VLDPAWLMGIGLHWEADPRRDLWLKAATDVGDVFIRMNGFPDEPLYSLEVDDGLFVDFDDFPLTWSRGPLVWPKTALPRWEVMP
jgi:hypothetical protein